MTAQVNNNRSTVVSKWRSVFRSTLSNSHNDDTLPRIRSDYGKQRNICISTDARNASSPRSV